MKIIILFFLLTFMCSCETNCETISKIYRDQECLLIVKNLEDTTSVVDFDVDGISLKTKQDTVYSEQNRWFSTYYKYIQKGDTIIKRKGELIFNIHKRDTIYSFKWECNGQVYK